MGVYGGLVARVVEHAREGRVHRVHVISAVEVVIDVHLPVTRQLVLDPAGELESINLSAGPHGERREVMLGRLLRLVEMDPDERAPGRNRDRNEAIFFLAEFLNAVELRRAAELAGQVVGPAVITAAKPGRGAARFIQDWRGAVATDVEERTQDAIIAANDQDRL